MPPKNREDSADLRLPSHPPSPPGEDSPGPTLHTDSHHWPLSVGCLALWHKQTSQKFWSRPFCYTLTENTRRGLLRNWSLYKSASINSNTCPEVTRSQRRPKGTRMFCCDLCYKFRSHRGLSTWEAKGLWEHTFSVRASSQLQLFPFTIETGFCKMTAIGNRHSPLDYLT